MADLLPCPFCGKAPTSRWNDAGVPGMEDCGYWGIDCCHAHAHADSQDEAAAAWNRRATARAQGGDAVLPPLPACGPVGTGFTAGQMRAYAIAALSTPQPDAVQLLRDIADDTTWRSNDNSLWPRIQAAVRAADGLSAQGAAGAGWLPIATAPRDGTNVLLGRPADDEDGHVGVSVQGHWVDAIDDGVDYMGNDAGFVDVHYQTFTCGRSFGAAAYRHAGNQPTHWQPLPHPPQDERG